MAGKLGFEAQWLHCRRCGIAGKALLACRRLLPWHHLAADLLTSPPFCPLQHTVEVSELIRELAAAGSQALGVQLEPGVEARLLAYARSGEGTRDTCLPAMRMAPGRSGRRGCWRAMPARSLEQGPHARTHRACPFAPAQTATCSGPLPNRRQGVPVAQRLVPRPQHSGSGGRTARPLPHAYRMAAAGGGHLMAPQPPPTHPVHACRCRPLPIHSRSQCSLFSALKCGLKTMWLV